MKKNFLLILSISLCILCGCAKHYKSVEDYSNAMTEVRNKLGDYTIEVLISDSNKESYYKSYIKGNLWKTEESQNGGKTYKGGILYDGKEVLAYSVGQPFAMTIPFKEIISREGVKDSEVTEMIMKIINPAGILVNWNITKKSMNINDLWDMGKITKKNDYTCRMLTNKKNEEICISDKYGIAVYVNALDEKKGERIVFNVKSIDNSPLSDKDVSLPSGIKKISMADMFRNIADFVQGNEDNEDDDE